MFGIIPEEASPAAKSGSDEVRSAAEAEEAATAPAKLEENVFVARENSLVKDGLIA
ncbi:MAG: hypothetical protein WC552_02250 [Candidatus Omnitrophota bacterium]